MKLLQDRLSRGSDLCGEPYEHAIHTTREHVNLRKVVIVSGCGFWEIDDFYPVLTHLKAFCYNTFPELAGCITGPGSTCVRGALQEGASESEIITVARAAGRELVRDYKSRPLSAMAGAACDGRAGTTWGRREWSGEILYKY